VISRRLPAVWAVSLSAAVLLSVSACAATSPGLAPSSPGDLNVVATTTQVGDFTRNVVGDTPGVTVTQLIKPNQSAHSYDPSAADLTALARADVLVINGVGLEGWLDDAIDASGFHGETIDTSTGLSIDNGNPHIWTSVSNAAHMVRAIAAGLASAENSRAAGFQANAAAYGAKLAALDTWIHANIDPVPASERLLVSNHDAFTYFTAAYGVTFVGSVIPSFDDNAEPSAAEMDTLVGLIRDTGVRAVFSESSINPKAADTIAKEAGVTVYSGDDALYADSLGPAGSPGDTYIHSQLHNVSRIVQSWGVTPTPAPSELQE
jgi:ABC-type Zn uptake system ZnuABC Zn-binding protein ZnuA